MWHIIVRGQTNVTLTKKLLKMEKNAVIAREKQPKTMTAEQRKLVEENYMVMVQYFKRKYHNVIPEKDDIVGVVEEGTCLASMSFDEERKKDFLTFAMKWVDGFIKKYLRDIMPHYEGEKRKPIYIDVVSIDSLEMDDEEMMDEGLTGEDLIPDETPDDVHRRNVHEIFKELMKGLTKRERKLILAKYDFDGQKSISEIAHDMGISESAVYDKINRIKVKLAVKGEKIRKAS